MPPKYNSISEISPSKETWNVLVRIVRMWFVKDMKRDALPYSLEMVLMDKKGEKIHATVRRTLIYKYEKELTEGHVYSISNFSVATNVGSYRTTNHAYKINFQFGTKIKKFDDKLIPANIYMISEPHKIFNDNYDTDYLIDVMGVLKAVGVEKVYSRNGSESKMIPIELNYDGFCFKVTLFGPYADELNAFIASGEADNAVVAVLLAKVKMFQGQPTIQNTIYATKLVFNPVYTSAVDLKKRMLGKSATPSPGISLLKDTSKVSNEDDFLNLTPMATIEGVKDCSVEKTFAVFGTVKFIDGSEWWYTACTCNKKVYPDERMYFCPKCNKHVINVSPRYMIKVKVIDHTDSATFLIFDRDATDLFNKSCADMIEAFGMGNLADIPEEIGDLVDKSYLFKVETNVDPSGMYEKSFKVKKIVADPVLIEKFKAKYVESLKNNIAGDEGVVDAEDTNVVGDDGILNHTKRDNVVDGVSLKDDNTTAEVTQNLMAKFSESSAVESTKHADAENVENTIDPTKDIGLITPAKQSHALVEKFKATYVESLKNNIAGDEGVVDAEDANVVGDDGILNHTERDNIVDGVGLKDHKTTAEV
ncbi:replication protein A 70 kDa DNA-binding subunit E-like [Trifolium pratense]|uniref:replication protein A 70 kDa DNA-binding subunit E-like n=1 Tax=Trifolium pratense TaxID=57577 RepID=UPI001E693994|nr:replication protein A 70 kDa DNA-binding subunit E-like [Trifolium pratense]